MTGGLVKRLRNNAKGGYGDSRVQNAAADRIEELEAENTQLKSIVDGNAVTVASLAMRVVEAEKLEADVAAAYRQGQRDMQMDADVAATEAIAAIILDDVAGKPFSLNSIHQRIQTVIRDLPIRGALE